MTVQAPELLRRPVTGRGNTISKSEQQFFDWLLANGWEVDGWECEEFFLPGNQPDPAKGFSWLRPDCKLASGVFLEHTDADEILTPEHLPELVRQCNKAKESGQDWISPRDYLHKKCSRISLAESLHGIVIVLLPAMIRRQLTDDPEQLHRLIARRQEDPAGYDEDLFRRLPTYLLDDLPVPA